ncbi:right-handed parallel beta-helix repeat-containing protein [Tichowtungia aerotolerans]|uniref:Right handed beta helix domain-containing protein n=1 Tax=Tichowtungia aerotolerans TaxID=2697043 RepID=A0A6P1M7T9_9BACT|nr:right-handed parallel beta-helix repeat-containing protein [Tichowtungia aerotolerans]QHI69941.1 hypothetical protein GT409_10920 [Tichowtungia aerotolerans]
MNLLLLSVIFLVSGPKGQPTTALYSNGFSGAVGTVATESSPVHDIQDYYSASTATAQMDGEGHLQSVNPDQAAATYRFRLDPTGAPSEKFGAVKLTADVRVPSENWVGFGFHGADAGGILTQGADAGPWALIAPTYTRVFGGCVTSNALDIIRTDGLCSAGDWITLDVTYFCRTETVSLQINDHLLIDRQPISHTASFSGQTETPSLQWAQVQFFYQEAGTNGGGIVDRLIIETYPGLQGPEDQAAMITPHPQFLWNEDSFEYGSEPIDAYQVQISTESGFRLLVVDDTIQTTRYVPVDPLAAGDYWWRVRALRDSGPGNWSLARRLTITEPAGVYTVPSGSSASDIAAVLAVADNNSPAMVRFERGTYRVAPSSDSSVLSLNGASDLIIDGNGSTVMIETPDAGFSSLKSCTNVTVRNFSIDYDPLPFAFGTVTAVDTGNNTFDLQLWDGTPRLDDDHMAAAQLAGNGWGVLLDTKVPGRLKSNVNDFYRTEDSFAQVDTNIFRLALTAAHQYRISDFSINDIFVKLSRQQGLNYVFKSKDLTFYKVVTYAAAGANLVGSYCDSVNVLRSGSRIADGRWASGCADGVHCQNFRNGPWVQGCSYQGIMDDGANIYAIPMYVRQKFSNTSFRFYNTATYDLRADDQLTFFDPLSGWPIGGARIVSSTATNVSGVNYVDITLDAAIEGAISAGTSKIHTTVYNVSRNGKGFVFRRNTFGDSRRYGLFIKSSDGLIVENTFEGLSGPAITVQNNPGWPEGLNSSGLSVISNLINGCTFSSYILNQERGSIELQAKGYNGTAEFESSWKGQSDICIQGNTIVDWQRRAIRAHCAENLLVEGNVIANTVDSFAAGQSNYAIYLKNTANAFVWDNQIDDSRSLTGTIEVQNSTNVVVLGNTVP